LVNISTEDYLKAIYQINTEKNEAATTTEVACKLDISKAATTEMVQKLSERGFINYEKYKGVELTDEGKKIALQILRRHRLWELFLIKVLGLTWSEVHDEAERLEHTTSDLLINKIDEYLGFPDFDPHGSPIPDKFGVLPVMPALTSLSECDTGISYRIMLVNDASNELMNYFTSIGIELKTELYLSGRLDFDRTLFIEINGIRHPVTEKMAKHLFVEKV